MSTLKERIEKMSKIIYDKNMNMVYPNICKHIIDFINADNPVTIGEKETKRRLILTLFERDTVRPAPFQRDYEKLIKTNEWKEWERFIAANPLRESDRIMPASPRPVQQYVPAPYVPPAVYTQVAPSAPMMMAAQPSAPMMMAVVPARHGEHAERYRRYENPELMVQYIKRQYETLKSVIPDQSRLYRYLVSIDIERGGGMKLFVNRCRSLFHGSDLIRGNMIMDEYLASRPCGGIISTLVRDIRGIYRPICYGRPWLSDSEIDEAIYYYITNFDYTPHGKAVLEQYSDGIIDVTRIVDFNAHIPQFERRTFHKLANLGLKHWVAFTYYYSEKNQSGFVIYYDSLNRPVHDKLAAFFASRRTPCYPVGRQDQNDGDNCGMYCIQYILGIRPAPWMTNTDYTNWLRGTLFDKSETIQSLLGIPK